MDRLLVAKLDAVDCEAELWLNGIALARVDAARPRALVPAHEYTVAGSNRIELVVWPWPAGMPQRPPPGPPRVSRVSDGRRSAQLRILLPRMGSPIDEGSARTLAELVWHPPANEAYEAPLTLAHEVSLPVSFPRWRWLDAPPAEPTPALHAQVLAFLQSVAQELAAGEFERFIAATRLRSDELASAYQRPAQAEAQRWREHLQQSHAAQALRFAPLVAEGLVLRAVAGGRLFECLGADGRPALCTEPDAAGRTLAFPLRVSVVDGKIYALR